eukprot:GHVQ01039441.1.p1 GENE.GHVQ01039441.1~~GHVQ01039441.1.p1  ORF type:complete len:326 (-),score=24.11 GHVQ01039441.1:499-1476(-)
MHSPSFTRKDYRFRQGSFGLKTMPWLFDQAMTAVRRALGQTHFYQYARGVVVYVDDFIVFATSPYRAMRATRILIDLLQELGWQINPDKTTGPTQHITFIGFVIDTRSMIITLEPAKHQKAKFLVDELLRLAETTGSNTTVWDVAKTVGFLTSIQAAFRIAPTLLRELHNSIAAFATPRLPCTRTLKRLATQLSTHARQDLHTLRKALKHIPTRRLLAPPNTQQFTLWHEKEVALLPQEWIDSVFTLYTDTSKHAWGAWTRSNTENCKPLWLQGTWSAPQAQHSINWLESKAIVLALKHFIPTLKWTQRPILVRTDNITAMAVNK